MIGAGRLTARVEFQTERRVDDGGGGAEQGTWRTVQGARGEYIPERGREAIAAHLQGSNMATLRVRWSKNRAALTTQARCLVNGVPHQIRSGPIDPDMRRQELQFVLERGVAPFS
jgi:head-tail adaptor